MHSITVTAVGSADPLGYLQDDPPPATPERPLLWDLQGGWKQPDDAGTLVVHLEVGVPVSPELFAARDASGYTIVVHRLEQEGLWSLEGEPYDVPDPPLRRRRST